MIEIAGKTYYIDFNAIEGVIGGKEEYKQSEIKESDVTTFYDEDGNVTGSQKNERVYNKPKEIDISKYELIRLFIEVLVSSEDMESDEKLGAAKVLREQPIPFKLAFNTLLFQGILKEL